MLCDVVYVDIRNNIKKKNTVILMLTLTKPHLTRTPQPTKFIPLHWKMRVSQIHRLWRWREMILTHVSTCVCKVNQVKIHEGQMKPLIINNSYWTTWWIHKI